MLGKEPLTSSDLQARQAWDFPQWFYRVSGLDLSIDEISCLQIIASKHDRDTPAMVCFCLF